MDASIQIKKLYSKKKEKNFLTGVLNLGTQSYFFNMSFEAMSIVLNKTAREIMELINDESFKESKKFPIDMTL